MPADQRLYIYILVSVKVFSWREELRGIRVLFFISHFDNEALFIFSHGVIVCWILFMSILLDRIYSASTAYLYIDPTETKVVVGWFLVFF